MAGFWRAGRLALMLALASLAAAAPVVAQVAETGLKALTTLDESKGWEAVGRINLGTSGFCTGALIAPDLVLTAAHCLYDKETGGPVAPETMEFLAGWRNGRAEAYRHVKRAMAHPGYDFAADDKMTRVSEDIALLQLDQPIRMATIPPFETAPKPMKGAEVGVVSYAQDRAESASLQEVCHVLARQPGMLVLSCSVDFGSSGAPVFTVENGVARIVSVVSAKADVDGKHVALAVDLAQPLAELRTAFAAEDGVRRGGSAFQAGQKPLRLLTARAGTGAGAKFVKP